MGSDARRAAHRDEQRDGRADDQRSRPATPNATGSNGRDAVQQLAEARATTITPTRPPPARPPSRRRPAAAPAARSRRGSSRARRGRRTRARGRRHAREHRVHAHRGEEQRQPAERRSSAPPASRRPESRSAAPRAACVASWSGNVGSSARELALHRLRRSASGSPAVRTHEASELPRDPAGSRRTSSAPAAAARGRCARRPRCRSPAPTARPSFGPSSDRARRPRPPFGQYRRAMPSLITIACGAPSRSAGPNVRPSRSGIPHRAEVVVRHARVGDERLAVPGRPRDALDREPVAIHRWRRELARARDGRHARQRAQALVELLEEARACLLGRVRAAATARPNVSTPSGSNPSGAVVIAQQTAHEQARAGEQTDAERDLPGDEHAAQPPRATALARAARLVAQRALRVRRGRPRALARGRTRDREERERPS